MTYDDAIRFLYALRLHGLKLGLDNPRRLAAAVGDPQRRLRFIHVAGTNGKGSTCAMLESMYRSAGLRVGLFTSPHLVSFRERIQVDRQWIAAGDVVAGVGELQRQLAGFDPQHPPTFFEVVTVLALRYFEAHRCDLVIWETGMGGRLDATNIVTPLASVITNIQLDHQKWLGQTVPEIAAEKAGIIKPGVPVVTGAEDPEALAVIRRVAAEHQTTVREVGPAAASALLRGLELPLRGEHQRRNAEVALATVAALQSILPLPPAACRQGLATVQWAGRMQRVQRAGAGEVWLDGAHNPAGVEALTRSLRAGLADRPLTLVLGILQDKDWRHMCQVLAPLARRILLVPVRSERTAAPMDLFGVCAQANPSVEIHALATLREAIDAARCDPLVLVTGSLYLVGEALELFGEAEAPRIDERGLNESLGAPRAS